MTAMPITYKKAHLKPGDLVLVAYPIGEMSNNPAHQFDGQEFVIKSVKTFPRNNGVYRRIYTLFGCSSKYGIPYSFLDSELIPM